MKGIKMSDCRFYVNEEARTVVCVIPDTENMLREFIRENFNFPELDFDYAIVDWSRGFRGTLNMPDSFRGKAVCAEEDEWDEELGRLIAFSRAKDKCYKSFFKRANLFVQAIDRRLGDIIDCFNVFGLQLTDKQEGMQQRIDEKIGDNEKEGDA